MRVFVTGATGLVGGGIARRLVAHGHEVRGLARSSAAAERLHTMGIEPVPGDLSDPDALRRGVVGADAVVHAAFARDAYEHLDEAIALDQQAVGILVNSLAGTGARLAYASGISVVGDTAGETIDEDTPLRTPPGMRWRRDLERAVLATGGLVLRLVLVYGHGEGDILTSLIRNALDRGESLYPAPGDGPWPAIHVDDAGEAFALALARAPARTVLNLATDQTTPRHLAEAIGRLIGRPARTRAVPKAEAAQVLPYADWLGGGAPVDARRARDVLGWTPQGPPLVWDIEHGSYRYLVERPDRPPER